MNTYKAGAQKVHNIMLASYCIKVVSSLAVPQSLESICFILYFSTKAARHLGADLPYFGMWLQKLFFFSTE